MKTVLKKENNMHSSPAKRIGRFVGWMVLSVTVFLGLSCGKKQLPVFEVRGQVLYEGKPVSAAFVALHPLEETPTGVIRPSATTDKDGWFVLSSYHAEDGAPAGDYAVTVEWRKTTVVDGDLVLGPNVLPARYSKPATSGLRISVQRGSNEDQVLRLKR
jgi:hypothetical protein